MATRPDDQAIDEPELERVTLRTTYLGGYVVDEEGPRELLEATRREREADPNVEKVEIL